MYSVGSPSFPPSVPQEVRPWTAPPPTVCAGSPGVSEEERQGTEFEPGKAAQAGELAKVLADERVEKVALVKNPG